MSKNIEFDISIETNGWSSQTVKKNIGIVGRQYHSDKESLLNKYRNDSQNYIDYEARNSCGDYLLYDVRDGLKIVTSPGFSGGYITETDDRITISTTLGSALSTLTENKVKIDEDRLIHRIFTKRTIQLPFTTFIKNIHRIPPGIIFDTDGSGFTRECYLPYKYGRSLNEGAEKMADALSGNNIVVALSGGVDSAFLACALAEEGIPFRTVTFNYELSSGASEVTKDAENIANELDVHHNIVSVPRPSTGEIVDEIENCMQKDFMSFQTPPHLGFLHSNPKDEVFIHGLNLGGLHKGKMTSPRYELTPDVLARPKNLGSIIFNTLTHNISETDLSHSYPRSRVFYIQLLSKIYPILNNIHPGIEKNNFGKENYEILCDPDLDSVLKGVISSGRPNMVWKSPDYVNISKQKYDASNIIGESDAFDRRFEPQKYLNEEVSVLKKVVGKSEFRPIQLIKIIDCFSYHQPATRSPVNYLPQYNSSVETPAMWSPILNYSLHKKYPLKSTLSPKKGLTNYIENHTGRSFEEITTKQKRWRKEGQFKESELVSRHAHRFSEEKSNLLPLLSEDSKHIFQVYKNTHKIMEKNQIESKEELRFLHRMINIELLLENILD